MMTDLFTQAWHWFILGFILMILELFVGAWVCLTSGIAALSVGLLVWLFGLSILPATLLWLVLAAILTWLSIAYIRPKMRNRTTAGLGAGSIIGQTGMVIYAPTAAQIGKVRFSVPIFGADEWQCRSQYDLPLQIGERVVVVDVIGNELLVRAMQPQSLTQSN
ncbi:NfeD family protein [Moraxella atlantae]|nr:NfeD family protein [Moraxella atlantae]